MRLLPVVWILWGGVAAADIDLSLRVAATRVDLAASSDTPMIGDMMSRALDAYNAAAGAYNQAHRAQADGAGVPNRSFEDVGFAEPLLVLAPNLTARIGGYRARLEVPVGVGDGLTTVGLGLYPMGWAHAPARARFVPYLLAGGAASYLRDQARRGALLEARVAGGLAIGRRVSIELGYRPWSVGGAIDSDLAQDLMDTYDPANNQPPPLPSEVIRGGTQTAAFDVAVAIRFD